MKNQKIQNTLFITLGIFCFNFVEESLNSFIGFHFISHSQSGVCFTEIVENNHNDSLIVSILLHNYVLGVILVETDIVFEIE